MFNKNKENLDARNLLSDFMKESSTLRNKIGVSRSETDSLQMAWEFSNRFLCNLISLENSLSLKDTLSGSLVRRYNLEMFFDFFYAFAYGLIEDRAKEFFSYEQRAAVGEREWKDKKYQDRNELRKLVPPWVASPDHLKFIYKKFSDMAHPNIISMRLNRRGDNYEYIMLRESIGFVVFEVATCFLYEPFRDLIFGPGKSTDFFDKMREFQSRAWQVILTLDEETKSRLAKQAGV